MNFIIETALRLRWVVLLMTLAVIGWGIWSYRQQPIDAYPDISGQMVQIITTFPGRAPEEIERQVTIPLENGLLGLPRVETVRSRTIFGLSLVQIMFTEGTEAYWARQRVSEKLGEIGLPDGVKPVLGPLATAYGEIYRYELVSDGTHSLIELRTLNDWVVTRALRRVPGVAEVANFGGFEKQYAVIFNQPQLKRFGLTLSDVEDAIKKNNAAGGGSVVSRGSMSLVIRGKGQLENIAQIQNIFVKSIGGTPIFLKDVGSVSIDTKIPNGIFSKDYQDPSVEGIVLMRKGENPSEVLDRVQKAVEALNSDVMPPGLKIVSYYDRTQLIDATLHTVTHSVSLGITLVVLVLIFFLGRPAMALLVSLTIPFALLFALGMMYLTNIPIGLLSIGAIDFGIIVDGAVIMAENIARRLGESGRRDERGVMAIIRGAALDMQRPVFISVLLIMVAFLPLLSLTRIEGLLFRPMAMTILFALSGALIFALVLVPVLATFFFRHGYDEWENPLLRWFTPVYVHLVRGSLRIRYFIATLSLAGLAIVLFLLVPRLGTEFLPYLDEGVLWVRVSFPEGTSLEQASEYGRTLREIALEFEDIKFAVVQAGRNDDGTDPFPPSRVEMMIGPRPRNHWKAFKTKQELVSALRNRYKEAFPTCRFNFTQPIIDSVTEDTNGTSANLAVEFTGPDSKELLRLGRETVTLLNGIRGATDVNIEQEGPQPQLVIAPNRAMCARYNVRVEDVMKLVNMAIGGEPVSTLYENEWRFDIVAKADKQSRNSPDAIGRLPVYTADGVPIPLSQVATITVIDGQTIIARADGRRRLTVRCDIVGRDQGGFVTEAKERFEAKMLPLPNGYRVAWLGMFENLERAFNHFMLLIPTTIGVIFLVLVVSFGSFRAGFILLLPIPFAFASGAISLYLRDMNLNVSTGVGFATLFGIAMMDGVLMFKGISRYRLQGASVDEAIVHGRVDRLRPGLMTSMVAILGLLPASLATGLGSDVQRPLATVIIWGLTGSTLFTLFVTPVFYGIFVPPLPEAKGTASAGPAEPLPDVSAREVVELVEYLHAHGDEEDLVELAATTNREFARVTFVVKAAELLGFVTTPLNLVALAGPGKRLAQASGEDRPPIWRDQLLTLRLFKEVYEVLERQPDRGVDSDFVLETIVTRMPYENYEKVFDTFVQWARFGKLFAYDEATRRITLQV